MLACLDLAGEVAPAPPGGVIADAWPISLITCLAVTHHSLTAKRIKCLASKPVATETWQTVQRIEKSGGTSYTFVTGGIKAAVERGQQEEHEREPAPVSVEPDRDRDDHDGGHGEYRESATNPASPELTGRR